MQLSNNLGLNNYTIFFFNHEFIITVNVMAKWTVINLGICKNGIFVSDFFFHVKIIKKNFTSNSFHNKTVARKIIIDESNFRLTQFLSNLPYQNYHIDNLFLKIISKYFFYFFKVIRLCALHLYTRGSIKSFRAQSTFRLKL